MQFELLLNEQLSDPDRDTIEAHVETCTRCQEYLERLVADPEIGIRPLVPSHTEPNPPADFVSRLKEIVPSRMPDPMSATPNESIEAVAQVHDRWAQRRLGQYQILEQLGKGSMGIVYKARHAALGKLVAIKVLPANLLDEVHIARFKHEIRAIGKLDHPNIVGTHDAGQVDGVHFLVMTFVDGIDLAHLVQRRGRLLIPDACELIRQAAVGLQHAHEQGLVHRDIKPANLVLARDGLVKVLDLGIARSLGEPLSERLTATGMLLGTADYLAPEQWDSPHAVDTRADIYSLGCTLFHLLAGQPPFAGPEQHSIVKKMRAHQEIPAPVIVEYRPDVPAQLAATLDRMLAKNPVERYSTPGEVAESLRPFSAGSNLQAMLASDETVAANLSERNQNSHSVDTAQPGSTFGEDSSRFGRHAWQRIATRLGLTSSVVACCLILGLAMAFWARNPSPRPLTEPLRIVSVTVQQYRGETAEPMGDIVTTTQLIRPNDSVRVSATLNAPGYCYLIAFNPDGTEQLCHPEDSELPSVNYPEHKDRAAAMTARPAKSIQLRYPQEQFFEPGVPGLQVFVLVASTEPLPPYAEWRAQVKSIPWNPGPYGQPWRWQFDGREFARLPTERGRRVDRGAPAEFKTLCRYFSGDLRWAAVRAIAFPVSGG
jgi:serine/threonine protein kinase